MARPAIRDYLVRHGNGVRMAFLLLVAAGACLMMFGLCLNSRFPNLSSDEGPFHGRPTDFQPTLPPYDSIAVGRGMVLEAWDASTTSTSAIVRMSTTGGRVLWTIEAEARGQGDTRRVSFGSVSYRLGGYTITGFADDSERATWYLGWWGGLSEYYYSS